MYPLIIFRNFNQNDIIYIYLLFTEFEYIWKNNVNHLFIFIFYMIFQINQSKD